MPQPIKYFSGRYPEIAARLGLTDECNQQPSGEAYLDDFNKDAPRTAWFSDRLTAEQLKSRFRDTSILEVNAHPIYSYRQGNLDGGVFGQKLIKFSSNFLDHVINLPRGSQDKSFFNSVRIAYLDDAGVLCGFTLSYIRDDSSNAIPVEHRPYLYTAAIIRGTNLAPNKRIVTFFSHPGMKRKVPDPRSPELPDIEISMVSNLDDIDKTQVPGIIKAQLNSRFLSQFIDDLLPGGDISPEQVTRLEARLPENGNMDNRDRKNARIAELSEFAGDDSKKLLDQLRIEAQEDVNFYMAPHFQTRLQALYQSLLIDVESLDDDLKCARLKLLWLQVLLEELAEDHLVKRDSQFLEPVQNAMSQVREALRQTQNTDEADARISNVIAALNEQYIGFHMAANQAIKQNYYELGEFAKVNYPFTPVTEPHKPKKLEQSFGRRNVYPILMGAVALLAVFGIALTISGVFAPIGLTTLLLTAAAFSLGSLAMAGLKMIYNEWKYAKASTQYHCDMNVYRSAMATNERYQSELKKLADSEALELRDNDYILYGLDPINNAFPARKPTMVLIDSDVSDDEEWIGAIERDVDGNLNSGHRSASSAMSVLSAPQPYSSKPRDEVKKETLHGSDTLIISN